MTSCKLQVCAWHVWLLGFLYRNPDKQISAKAIETVLYSLLIWHPIKKSTKFSRQLLLDDRTFLWKMVWTAVRGELISFWNYKYTSRHVSVIKLKTNKKSFVLSKTYGTVL